jgi:Protein of unknown function (DUF2829)
MMTPTFDFSIALAALKRGQRVAREGWNGKGMFLFLVPGSTFKVDREPLLSIMGEGTQVQYHAHIDMKTAQGYVVPWLASQADLLATDWMVVEAISPAVAAHIAEVVRVYIQIANTTPFEMHKDPVSIVESTVRQRCLVAGQAVPPNLRDLCAKALFDTETPTFGEVN